MMAIVRDDPAVVALVARARDDDQAAWNAIVERFAPLVWAVCRRYRLSRADAEDVWASVWLRLVERLDTLREPRALPGWLATTASHECLTVLRARKREVPITDDITVDETSPASDEWLLTQERHIALRAGFAELPDHCRTLLALVFADPPLPYTEISRRLNLRVGGIGPTRQRCLEKLRRTKALAAFLEPTERR
jgi:RNA polymerase sigma factor (sigma-70 family)